MNGTASKIIEIIDSLIEPEESDSMWKDTWNDALECAKAEIRNALGVTE